MLKPFAQRSILAQFSSVFCLVLMLASTF